MMLNSARVLILSRPLIGSSSLRYRVSGPGMGTFVHGRFFVRLSKTTRLNSKTLLRRNLRNHDVVSLQHNTTRCNIGGLESGCWCCIAFLPLGRCNTIQHARTCNRTLGTHVRGVALLQHAREGFSRAFSCTRRSRTGEHPFRH